jgi:tetratricopeptide (TPR) repeat protein
MLRRRGPGAEEISAARELSRQGVAAMDSGNWAEAENLLKKSIITSPDDAATRSSLAEALWHRGAKQEALEQIEDAVDLDKSNARLRVRAGEMSLASGANEAALKYAERAIRSDPKLASAWALRGRCFQQSKQPDRALADLQHALDIAPDKSDVLLDVAVLYRQRGQASRSLTAVHHLLDTYPSAEEPQDVLMLQGLALLDLGRPQQAAEALAAAARKGPANADLLYHLAQAYSVAGHVDQATTTAQQALAQDASHQPSRQLLTELAARTGPGETLRR